MTQTRRSIGVSTTTYDAIEKIATARNVGKSKVLEEMINKYLDGQTTPPSEIDVESIDPLRSK